MEKSLLPAGLKQAILLRKKRAACKLESQLAARRGHCSSSNALE